MVDISIQSSHEKEKATNICLYLLLIKWKTVFYTQKRRLKMHRNTHGQIFILFTVCLFQVHHQSSKIFISNTTKRVKPLFLGTSQTKVTNSCLHHNVAC